MNPFTLLFSIRGRIGRGAFLIGLVLAGAILAGGIWGSFAALEPMARLLAPQGINAAVVLDWMWLGLALLFAWAIVALVLKRLHDRGRTGWWGALAIAPLAVAFFGNDLLFPVARQMLIPPAVQDVILIVSSGLTVWLAIETLLLPGSTEQNRFDPE